MAGGFKSYVNEEALLHSAKGEEGGGAMLPPSAQARCHYETDDRPCALAVLSLRPVPSHSGLPPPRAPRSEAEPTAVAFEQAKRSMATGLLACLHNRTRQLSAAAVLQQDHDPNNLWRCLLFQPGFYPRGRSVPGFD